MRLTLKRNILLCVVFLFIVSLLPVSAEQPKYVKIEFLSTNDLHLHELPFTMPADPRVNRPEMPDVGGMARIAGLVNRLRAESRCPVMLMDSGDTTYGTGDLARAFRGGSIVAVMNAMGYDAMVPGNHEFQWHSGELLRNLNASRFPWVCANVVYRDTGKLFTQPYIIKEVGGVRVAIFGLTNNLLETQPRIYVSGPEIGLKVLNPTEVAQKIVPKLREKADIVVLLSHLGRGADVLLAKTVPGIDLILGGHSHSRIPTPQMVSVGQPTAFWVGAVPVVQAWQYGIDVGRTTLIFRRDPSSGKYTLMSCKGDLVRIDKSLPEDPTVASIIKSWQRRLQQLIGSPALAQPVSNK